MANIIAVSALTAYVKSLLDGDAFLKDIAVSGEIANCSRRSKTGHIYFTLRDDKASVKAVMFRADAENLAFTPEDGMLITARGRVSLYEASGSFQLYATHLFPSGEGSARLAYLQLKQRLQKEGLFETEKKKMLPEYPSCVGLVTSKEGAALQDILKVASRRCPTMRFVLASVTVQGLAASKEVASAIALLGEHPDVEIIIVARGGGAAEDLWVFNDEGIARAAFASKKPIVSAIGHEVDWTILDHVADLRAPTPSAAAEMVAPDMRIALQSMQNLFINIEHHMHTGLDLWYNRLASARHQIAASHTANAPQALSESLKACRGKLASLQQGLLARKQSRFAAEVRLASKVNPYAILSRGYAAISFEGRPVCSASQAQIGQTLMLRLADGTLGCEAKSVSIDTETKRGYEHAEEQ